MKAGERFVPSTTTQRSKADVLREPPSSPNSEGLHQEFHPPVVIGGEVVLEQNVLPIHGLQARQTSLRLSGSSPSGWRPGSVGAFIIRMGFGGPLYYSYNTEPPN